MKKLRKGQSTIEVVILFIVVAVAIFLMQTYLKRAVQGKSRESAEKIGGGKLWDYSDADASHIVYHKEFDTESRTTQTTYSGGKKRTDYLTFKTNQTEWYNAIEVGNLQSLTAGTNW